MTDDTLILLAVAAIFTACLLAVAVVVRIVAGPDQDAAEPWYQPRTDQ